MKSLKNWFNALQVVNVLGFLGQFIAIMPESLQGNKYVLIVQGLIGILLPSLGGIGHKIAYGRPPDA